MENQDVKTNESETVEKPHGGEQTAPPTVLEIEKKEDGKEEKVGVRINAKDYSWLKKNRYEDIRSRFDTTFILQHKNNPNKIVELRASSATHACHLIHWKPQQVRLLGTKKVKSDIVDAIQDRISQSISSPSIM